MKLLAFETATEACSVALWIDGRVLERYEVAPRRHAELALPWAEELLAEAGIARAALDAIAVGRGPGAFTGVRLGIALGQGIAMALDLPAIAVSTLAALAARAPSATPGDARHVLAAIDARMGEVYVAAFRLESHGPVALGAEVVQPPDAVQLPDAGGSAWAGVGTGFDAASGVLRLRVGPHMATIDASALPRASDVAAIAVQALARGEGVAPEQLQPAYLRDNVAMTTAEQQAARAAR